jgi:hypothetical protein
MNLTGRWRGSLDATDVGSVEKWYAGALPGSLECDLPGSLAVQGIGEEITVNTPWTGTIFDRAFFDSDSYAKFREPGNIKVPFWLQPDTYYMGAAWYQREIEIPAAWSGKRVLLSLERPHGQTTIWLDDQPIGSGDSLSAPHEFVLSGELRAGRHRLTIRVDNRLHVEVGENAHSVSDHTQGNWNGVTGVIELRATGQEWIQDLQVYPEVESRSVTVRGKVNGFGELTLEVAPRGKNFVGAQRILSIAPGESGTFETRLVLGEAAQLWDEFQPALYDLTARFAGDAKTVGFGLREFATCGTQFTINGRPVFLRGALDCCIFPATGHPPMDVESWRKILRTIQEHGLNHVRFHSWCPPEAAFIAGDELGIYFQVECAVWPNSVAVLAFNSPAGIGDGNEVDRWAYQEGERILRAYGNHPCFVLMACGNEPGGPQHRRYLSEWVRHFRARDGRRLYTGAAGWPELPENEFQVIPDPRVHQWGDGLKCRINGRPPATLVDYREIISSREVPVISHEIGQWCAYPALGEVGKYRGHLQPRNFEIFAESLAAHNLTQQADDFVYASGKLQALCYKEEIESALRTPGLGGFQLLGLQDFPGQGTAPVGVLDAFWTAKGYLSAAEMRRYCSATVPLARLPKRVFTTEEHLEARLEVAHFGSAPLLDPCISWELVIAEGGTVLRGELPRRTIPSGNLVELGPICVDLKGLSAPAKYRLLVSIKTAEDAYENHWELWIYPRSVDPEKPKGLFVARSVTEAIARLKGGGEVLLIPQPTATGSQVALGFSPIFWNTSCTQGQPPHTLGILCDPTHPAFRAFPTDPHSNWQWWYLIQHATAVVLDNLPPQVVPVVQVIDDWFTNRKLGLVFEARVGAGNLLVCSIDLLEGTEENPVARQFLHSLLEYVGSSAFQPTVELSEAELKSLFKHDA